MPLGYLLVRSSGGIDAGGKEDLLRQFLSSLRDDFNLNVLFTLSDKDWSEINALRAVFPAAKHQLCFWHALRAVKQRLAVVRRAPAFYDVNKATQEFSWIDPHFKPVSQLSDGQVLVRRIFEHLFYTNLIW